MGAKGGSDVAGMLLHSIWPILKSIWPLLALVGLWVVGDLAWSFYKGRRLARSGINEIDTMDGGTFEQYLQTLFKGLGYRVERTKMVGDYGADLVLAKDGERTVVQAKRWKKPVGIKAVQEVVASKGYYKCDRCLVVTNSTYTQAASELARANKVELWDRGMLVDRLLQVAEAREEAGKPMAPVAKSGAGPSAERLERLRRG